MNAYGLGVKMNFDIDIVSSDMTKKKKDFITRDSNEDICSEIWILERKKLGSDRML